MRQLAALDNEASAQRFVDYLLTQGVGAKHDRSGEQWHVWVRQEDQLDAARQHWAEFEAEPNHERYRAASQTAQALRNEELKRERQARAQQVELRRRWEPVGERATPVTWLLILASCAVALFSNFGQGDAALLDYLYIAPSFVEGDLRYFMPLRMGLERGEVWRLLTPMLLHFGAMHLLFNMLWMHDLGRRIESLLGPLRYLGMVVVIQLASGLLQYYYQGAAFGGMSGVVCGLFGYAWMQSRYGGCLPLYLSPATIFFMLFFLALGAMSQLGPIANWAHGGGLAAGMLLGLAPIAWNKLRR